jgi:hypothetical protein
METNVKYIIVYQNKIVGKFKDPVKAIRINRLKYPAGSEVYKVLEDNKTILLAKNVKY